MLKNFLKGVVAGIGGTAPGLSGSVLLVILGAYERMIQALGTLFKDFKKNVLFLLPLVAGMGVGALLFSKVVDFLLENFEYQTRYTFLGLILGTIPLFYREVKKKGFKKPHYLLILAAAAAGCYLFIFKKNLFPQLTQPNVLQSMLFGVVWAGSSVIPGVDSAAIMSAFGMYELYVSSLANFNLPVLIPAVGGLVVGAAVFSVVMNMLLKKIYTGTFSVIFGLFLSVVPSVVMKESCYIASVPMGFAAVGFAVLGMIVSLYLGDIEGNNKRIRRLFKK